MTASPPPTLSAGIVPLRSGADGVRVLLLRCYRYWDLPKGEVEPGEEPLAAAIREFTEETGLGTPAFRWGHEYIETPPYGRGKVARYYLAEALAGDVTLPVNPALGRAEHHEYRWLSFDDAEPRLHPRLKRVLGWARRRILG